MTFIISQDAYYIRKYGGSGGFSTFTQTDSDFTGASSSSITYTSKAIGTAAANRVVVVFFSASASNATGVSVGGNALTKRIDEGTILSGLQIWSGTVATGTTANIVVTAGGTMNNPGLIVGVFNSGASAVPSATNSGVVNTATSIGVAVTVPAGGFGVWAVMVTGGTVVNSWTNATQDASGSNAGEVLAEASTTSTGSITGTANLSANAQGHMVAATWGP